MAFVALVKHNARYSITWSARSSSDCGIGSPSALAVFKLTTSLQLMAVEIFEVEGRAPYPTEGDRVPGRHAPFAKDSGPPVRVRHALS